MRKASGFLKAGERLVCRQIFGKLMSCLIFFVAAARQALSYYAKTALYAQKIVSMLQILNMDAAFHYYGKRN